MIRDIKHEELVMISIYTSLLSCEIIPNGRKPILSISLIILENHDYTDVNKVILFFQLPII